jgi:hypothetical protein
MSENKLATLEDDTTSTTKQHTITAVDIVLEPDETMIQHAQAAHAGLLENFPKGYALGNEHAPHISVMGGYVYTASLDKRLKWRNIRSGMKTQPRRSCGLPRRFGRRRDMSFNYG